MQASLARPSSRVSDKAIGQTPRSFHIPAVTLILLIHKVGDFE